MAFKSDASLEFKQISEDMITLRQTVAEGSVQLVFSIMLTEPPDELAFAPPTINTADPAGATRASPTTGDINRESEAEVGSELAGNGGPLTRTLIPTSRRRVPILRGPGRRLTVVPILSIVSRQKPMSQ